jgi:hypothetical protein
MAERIYEKKLTEIVSPASQNLNHIITELGLTHEERIKMYAHILINSRDVPKDAAEKGHLKQIDSIKIKSIIRDLYYIEPDSGIKGPGTVGDNHVIEKVFKKNDNMRKILESPMEIPVASAHGAGNVDINTLALSYIFMDSGRTVVNMLGNAAGNLAYSSPTNFIDSAPVGTRGMNQHFLNQPVITIASQKTLMRFGFRLTKEITMYKKPFSEEVLGKIKEGVLEGVLEEVLQHTEYLITFDIDRKTQVGIPPTDIGNPFGDRIIMAFDENHNQINIPGYMTTIGRVGGAAGVMIDIFNRGNPRKNEYLKKIFEQSAPLTPNQKFLKHFLIEVKLLGDTNHCMFSRELIDKYGFNSGNIAFGTCDFDVVLRFILESVNVFYKAGACTKYYIGKKMNPIQRLIYMNENKLSLIQQFNTDLYKDHTILYKDKDDDKRIPYRGMNYPGWPFDKDGMKRYISSLILMYEDILEGLKGIPKYKYSISKCIRKMYIY